MVEKKVTVTLDGMGNPVFEAHNFQGRGCAEATAGLEAAVAGNGEASREYKPEWNRTDNRQQQGIKQTNW